MKNPLDIFKRLRSIITQLRERNTELVNKTKEALRAEEVYKNALIDEMRKNEKSQTQIFYLNNRIKALEEQNRSIQSIYRKRVEQLKKGY